MSRDNVEIAHLSNEQLVELTDLEDKLGVTLVAYENTARSTDTASDQ